LEEDKMVLEMEGVFAGYGKNMVIRGISINVNEGEIVAVLGHNGAGKTTTLKTIMGILRPMKGEIIFSGAQKTFWSPRENVKRGISYIPQGMAIFPDLTVEYNLELASYTLKDQSEVRDGYKEVFQLFPILEERKWQRAGTLSGGQQRMLSVGMALMTRPKLLLMDEPSLGLAPLLVEHLMDAVKKINSRFNTAILLVEQNVKQALLVAKRAYVMKVGQIILEESTQTLLKREHLWELF
jgi:branched-chain amino acid transport system ATP-binding protein